MINKLHGKPKGQCRMDNLETHAILGTKKQNEDKKKPQHRKLNRLSTWTPSKNLGVNPALCER
jgi:hypothetical protein